jgi:hypothetical protein
MKGKIGMTSFDASITDITEKFSQTKNTQRLSQPGGEDEEDEDLTYLDLVDPVVKNGDVSFEKFGYPRLNESNSFMIGGDDDL